MWLVLTPYLNGTAKVTTSLYINSTSAAVKHICDDRQPNYLFNDGGWGSDKKLSDGTYIPNCMTGAEKYFDKGLYDSSVSAKLDKAGNLRVGIKCTSAASGSASWTMFDHFRLHFFGKSPKKGDVNGDCVVDVADIATIISVMASTAAPSGEAVDEPADVNGDGVVDVADIATVIGIMSKGE